MPQNDRIYIEKKNPISSDGEPSIFLMRPRRWICEYS